MQARPWHAGAYTDYGAAPPLQLPAPPQLDQTQVLHALAKAITGKAEAAAEDKGKLNSTGRPEERQVYLARACDNFRISLAPGILGKECLHALRGAAAHSRPLLRQLKLPVNLTNRICYGLAAFQIGGRDVASLPRYSLSAADFPPTSEEEFDAWRPPADTKLEKRPRAPNTLVTWHRHALRESWVLALFYGEEHLNAFEACANSLLF